jgi:hypothetical protein
MVLLSTAIASFYVAHDAGSSKGRQEGSPILEQKGAWPKTNPV